MTETFYVEGGETYTIQRDKDIVGICSRVSTDVEIFLQGKIDELQDRVKELEATK